MSICDEGPILKTCYAISLATPWRAGLGLLILQGLQQRSLLDGPEFPQLCLGV